jgi:acetyl-CoA acetyltransferase
VAIIGVAESDQIGRVPDKSDIQLHVEAAWNAMEEAGVKKEEIDGVFTAGWGTLQMAEYMGITPRYTDSTSVGGSSFVIHLGHAVTAIANGLIEMALVTHGQSGYSRISGTGGGGAGGDQWYSWQGAVGAPSSYSLAAERHMHQYGTTHDDLAEIAVATRKWAQLNPKALMRDPMSFEDYHNSRWVSYPFHLLDCCLVTDAGGAYLVTSLERAKNYKKKPIAVLGFGESHTHGNIGQMPDLTWTPARISGPRALEMAGVGLKDIDLAMIYDSFTYTVGVTLESLGFCGPGEFGQFVKGQRTAPGGDFPMNTNGGGLSYTHSGMYGMFLVLEAVRQLRGETGERQVKDAKIALMNGTGGSLSSTGTTILTNQV